MNDDFLYSLDSLTSFDEACSLGADCIEKHALSNWQLGDLACRVADIRPDDPLVEEKAATLRKFAAAINVQYARVKQLADIARAVPLDYRSPALSHSHYRVLVQSRLPFAQMLAWAAKAEDGRWNAAGLAKELAKTRDTRRDSPDRERADALLFLQRGLGLARDVTAAGALAVAVESPEEINRALSAMAMATRIFKDAQDEAARKRRKRSTNGAA